VQAQVAGTLVEAGGSVDWPMPSSLYLGFGLEKMGAPSARVSVRPRLGAAPATPPAPARAPAAPPPAPAASAIVGTWRWFLVDGDEPLPMGQVTFGAGGKLLWSQGDTGTWTQRGGQVFIRWDSPQAEEALTLSPDGQTLTGTSRGFAIRAAKIGG
jgi:hypothetical protein